MTREEARDQIVIFMCDEQKVINDRDKQALDMAIQALSQKPTSPCDACRFWYDVPSDEMTLDQARQAVKDLRKKWAEYLEQEPSDTVSRGVFEQVMRERDVAIEQLKELGYELGQKIEPCEVEATKLQQAYNKGFDDCRQAVLDIVNSDWKYEGMEQYIYALQPVTPQQKSGHWIHFAQSELNG